MLATLEQLKATLGITDTDNDAKLTSSLMTANALIAGYIGADLSDTSDRNFTTTVRFHAEYYMLPVWPVISITSVTADSTLQEDTSYAVRSENGMVDLMQCFSSQATRYGSRVTTVYKAGFEADKIPQDLTVACINIAAALYTMGGAFAVAASGPGALKSMTMFDAMSMSFEHQPSAAGGASSSSPEGIVSQWAYILDTYRVKLPVLQ